ncbi:MAG: PQQ-binding-like beta-propeller repeat protein [Actinomycetota bacterium]|nr:PQQ-binding-like beta-propeller repeat protein [Actinomycetota bacterium]
MMRCSRLGLLACALVLIACGDRAVGAAGAYPPAGDRAQRIGRGSVPGGDWTRFDYDAQRSGIGPAATGITARDLGLLRRRVVQIDGTVDSSAIELHAVRVRGRIRDVIVLTTTYGRTIALAAGTGAKLWEYAPADIGSYQGSAQITNATPVADPDRRYVYAASPDGRIHKLPLANGGEVRSAHWPVSLTFDATREKLGSALNISGKYVVAVTGGYLGDQSYYQGHVVTIDRTTGHISHVWNSLCSDRHRLIDPPKSCPYPGNGGSAIWAREGAVIEPHSGRILVATGNAAFNGSTDWGNSVLELTPNASRLLHNWTPTDQAQLNAVDGDVGSTAPALLPEVAGRRLAVQGGKAGVLDLLDLDRLDGTRGPAGPRRGGELQQIREPGGSEVLTAPAVRRHADRTYVFVANDSGTTAYVLGGGRHPRLSVAWQDATPGTSPVVAGGLLYVYDEVNGALKIRQPTGGRILTSLPSGKGHWNTPIVVGGRIVLPEGNANDHATSGTVDIYHLPGR